MSMIDIFLSMGREDALKLREEAANLNGTQIIDREHSIPAFDCNKDYSSFPVGSPVMDEGQVWKLIQPHNAVNYDGRPSTLRALWEICHTTNAKKAKLWVDPLGTSGMYMTGECYKDKDGNVWQAKNDNLVHDAKDYPSSWVLID